MKKPYNLSGRFCSSSLGRYFKIGLIALLVFTTALPLAASTYEQPTKFNFDLKNVTLSELIDQIELNSEYNFTFQSDVVDVNRKISVTGTNLKIEGILKNVFEGTDVQYTISGRNVLLEKKPAPEIKGEASLQQQTWTISGTIKDQDGEPLPWATVVQKGTSNGTVTDVDGKFVMNVTARDAILVVSSIGYSTQEITVQLGEPMQISMEEDISKLDEVVVIGYGSTKKKDLTGAVVHMDMAGKEMTPTTDLAQALQGAAAGLNATQGSGAGVTGTFSIRGATTLSGSTTPLIVVDGVIFDGSTTDLNMNDVESIDVLKDASAAAVYGSRASNGVIVITTKRGKSEKPLFSFNAYTGVQSLTNTKMTEVMNAQQYAVKLVDYYYQEDLYSWYKTSPTNDDDRPVRPDVTNKETVAAYLRTTEESDNYLAGKSINWMDKVFHVAPIQNYNLSVSGNTNKTNYYISGAYTDQQGISVGDHYKHLNLSTKFENHLTDWLTIEFDPWYSRRDYSGLSASYSYGLMASPLGNERNADGSYTTYVASESYAYNPMGYLDVSNDQVKNMIRLLFKGKIEVPWVKGLNYEINYTRDLEFDHNYSYYPTSQATGQKVNGYAEKYVYNQDKLLINNILSYKRKFSDHNIDATFLYSDYKITDESTDAIGQNFTVETLGYNGLSQAATQTNSSTAERELTLSLMGRATYSYKERYMVTGTIRRDGYSGFGADHKWGNFPAVSLGWVASEESFLKSTPWLNFLKVRASLGVNGNQGIGPYYSQSQLSTISTMFGDDTAIGQYSSSMGNSDLKWEQTVAKNLGLDFEIFGSVLSGSLNYYTSSTTGILLERNIPQLTGNSSVWSNIGQMKNHGYEVSLNSSNIKKPAFSWTSGFNFSLNRNKITELYDGVTEDINNNWFVGKSINSIYGYKVQGVWQESDLFNGNIVSGYYPGQYKMKDLDGDGTISASADRKVIGNGVANYRFSVANTLTYKGWSLYVMVNSIQGGHGYDLGNATSAVVAGDADKAYRVNRTAIYHYWTPDNQSNKAPGIYNNPSITPSVYMSQAFVRLQYVTLAYTVDNDLVKKWGLNSLKFYATGTNLYTWTKWPGWDPNVGSPVMRSIILGLNVSF